MGTVELIIACHEIHLQRQQRRTHKDIVQSGRMVADEEKGSLHLAEVLLEGVMYLVLGVNKQLPDHTQCIVHPIGIADFPGVNGFFNRYFFRISLFLPD